MELNSTDGRLLLAVDLGGTRLRAAVATADGVILKRVSAATPAAEGPRAVIAAIADAVSRVAAAHGQSTGSYVALGVAAPGPLDPVTGVVYSAPNLPGWRDFPFAAALQTLTGMSVWVDNDANLAGLGEARRGAGCGCESLLYLTVSTGVGGAILQGGRLVHGASGLAGELGHVIVLADGPACNFGHRGCLEALASGTAIARRAEEAIALGRATSLERAVRVAGRITARDVAEAASSGDRVAGEIWTKAARYLGLAVGSFINVLDPQRVVLGGGVIGSWDSMRDHVARGIADVVMSADRRPVDVLPAALGDDAGLVGAALSAWERSTA